MHFSELKTKEKNIMSNATLKHLASKAEAHIRALVESIDKAHHNKDAAAIVAPYAQDAVVCDLAPPLSHRGMDLQGKQAWLDTWDGPVDRESRDFNITVSGDFAFCHGFYQLGGTPKAAGKPISFWMRATVCMHRDGDAWRIVHEHTSVPFYMDGSLRPAFDLKP
jgi:ketosteroid isomerase-like protein